MVLLDAPHFGPRTDRGFREGRFTSGGLCSWRIVRPDESKVTRLRARGWSTPAALGHARQGILRVSPEKVATIGHQRLPFINIPLTRYVGNRYCATRRETRVLSNRFTVGPNPVGTQAWSNRSNRHTEPDHLENDRATGSSLAPGGSLRRPPWAYSLRSRRLSLQQYPQAVGNTDRPGSNFTPFA